MSSVFPPIGGAAFIPMHQCRGLRRDLVNSEKKVCGGVTTPPTRPVASANSRKVIDNVV